MDIFVVIPERYAGCGFYRQWQPHKHLTDHHDDVNVVLSAGVFDEEGNLGVDTDMILFHKSYYMPLGIWQAKKMGIPVIVDFDDWWRVDSEHLFYQQHKDKTTDAHIAILEAADYVIVTTELLRQEALKHNKNVVVIPNAFDPSYKSCENKRIEEDKIVFGYLGGHCHRKDVDQLRGVNNRLSNEFSNYKFRLMGMDGSTVYKGYADVMGAQLGKEYFDWMERADIWNYHRFYNYLDVSLVPLVDNKFNNLKSELKLIEAGFFKKAVIVDNVHPYRDLIKHKQNAMVVNKYTDWYKHCKYLLRNPNAITELGEALYETMQPYHIDKINEKRINFYKDVLKNSNTNSSNGRGGLQGDHIERLHELAELP